MPEVGFIAAFEVDPSSVQDKLSSRTFQPRSFVIIRRVGDNPHATWAPLGPALRGAFIDVCGNVQPPCVRGHTSGSSAQPP